MPECSITASMAYSCKCLYADISLHVCHLFYLMPQKIKKIFAGIMLDVEMYSDTLYK